MGLFESRFSKNFEISLSAPTALRASGVATSSTNDSTRFFFHRLLVDTFASTRSHRRTPVPTQTRADTLAPTSAFSDDRLRLSLAFYSIDDSAVDPLGRAQPGV